MKLGLFTDPHYSHQTLTCSNRRPSLSYGKVREAMEAMTDCDLVLCLGDLINDCGDPAENRERLAEIAALFRSFAMPVYCLPGNHDYEAFTLAQFQQISGQLAPPSVLRVCGKTLLFPNASCREDGTPYDGNPIDWTDSFLPAAEMDLLRRTLAEPETEEAYVFFHQNLDPDVESHHIIRNAPEIRSLLAESGKVRAVFQGHYHPGHENEIDGIRYRTLPAMCEGEENRFAIIDL